MQFVCLCVCHTLPTRVIQQAPSGLCSFAYLRCNTSVCFPCGFTWYQTMLWSDAAVFLYMLPVEYVSTLKKNKTMVAVLRTLKIPWRVPRLSSLAEDTPSSKRLWGCEQVWGELATKECVRDAKNENRNALGVLGTKPGCSGCYGRNRNVVRGVTIELIPLTT
jgi:hypothetical protein